MRFSIIIPTHNYGKFIEEAIESVISQKGNFSYEILIIDDASTDNTKEIVMHFLKENKNIKYFINRKNEGTAFCYKKGISIARGDIVCILDADDRWKKNKLLEVDKFFKKNEEASLLFHNIDKIDIKGKLIAKKIMKSPSSQQLLSPFEILKKDFFGPLGSTLCFNRQFITKIKIYKKLYAAVDGYLLLATLLHKGRVFYIDKSLSYYRAHETSTTYAKKIEKLIFNLKNYSTMLRKCYLLAEGKKYPFIDKLAKMAALRAKILERKKINKLYFEKLLLSLFRLIGIKKFIIYSIQNFNNNLYLLLRQKYYSIKKY
jgi:glycosyltransferase involved in cell wall biosynthesis